MEGVNMSIKIDLKHVSLPEGFFVNQIDGDGNIKFNRPVALPYSDASLQRYSTAFEDTNFSRELCIQKQDLTTLLHNVLQATLPEFTGTDGFYQASLKTSMIYGSGLGNGACLQLIRNEGYKPRAMVRLLVHSSDKFFPQVTQEGVRRPTIESVQVEGSVYVRSNIPHPEGGNCIYYPNVSAAILSALLTESDVVLGGDQMVKTGYELGNSRVYVQVTNPTLERVQAALGHEEAVAAFFKERARPLIAAAALYVEAQEIHRIYKQTFLDGHKQLSELVVNARKELGLEIPMPANIDDVVAIIDVLINAKLKKATDVIADLYAKFPRGIIEYATPKNVSL
jgi:hypothetical protein